MRRAALHGKKILVTAGPTWVALDAVRVISNVSTGAMGLALAQKAAAKGADVDVLLGPVEIKPADSRLNVFRYRYFDELKGLIAARLKTKPYDIILHAAAVSDYVIRARPGKIASGKKKFMLRLAPSPKLISLIRRMNPRAFLVMFKLESGVSEAVLMKRSRAAMKKAKADLVVANCFHRGSYRGFVLDANSASKCCATRQAMASCLLNVLQQKIKL